MSTHFLALTGSLVFTLSLIACSPTQNWRDVGFEGNALKVQLPCKPDRTTRSVPLGGIPVDLQVVGCESGSAVVAVMTASLPAGADVGAAMTGWQKATLDNARVPQPLKTGQRQAWLRPGHLPLATSVHVSAPGEQASGKPVNMEAVWGAVAEGERVRLVHAVVYDRNISAELANTLFESIKP